MRKRYINIALPESLIKKVDYFVKQDEWGYKSRAEVIKEAVRDILIKFSKYEDIKKTKNKKEKTE